MYLRMNTCGDRLYCIMNKFLTLLDAQHINLWERVREFKVMWNGIRQNANLNMTSLVTELLVHRQRSEPK
jgi:hypothetical protein